MMLTVLGGSGRIARHVVEQAPGAGDDVTVLVRSADRSPEPPNGLRVVVGTVDDERALD